MISEITKSDVFNLDFWANSTLINSHFRNSLADNERRMPHWIDIGEIVEWLFDSLQ